MEHESVCCTKDNLCGQMLGLFDEASFMCYLSRIWCYVHLSIICRGGISIYLCALVDKSCGHPCTPALLDRLLLITISLHPQSVPNRILSSHNPQWQPAPDAEKHKERPLPPKRVDGDAEHEPVSQLRVSEEVEGSGWRATFDELGHVDPFFHPRLLWPCERVHEEHKEQARIDSNMVLESFPCQPLFFSVTYDVPGVKSVGLLRCLSPAKRESVFHELLTYISHGANGVDVRTIIG